MRIATPMILLLAAVLPARADGWPDDAVLGFDGIGPLRIGMPVVEVSALGLPLDPPITPRDEQEPTGCFQVSLQQAPDVALMFEDGRLVRIDADSAAVRTAEGLGIGSLETDLAAAYGDEVSTEPHFYAPAPHHYMKRFSSDGRHAMVFETDGVRVDRFRAGEAGPAQYVEGCL